MMYNPDIHKRRSIRLKGYDYSLAGAYFITIVAQGRLCLFGDVVDGEMRLNGAGKMVCQVWDGMPGRFPSIEMDEFVVMPNHVHGVIIIRQSSASRSGVVPNETGATTRATTSDARATTRRQGNHKGCPYGRRWDGGSPMSQRPGGVTTGTL